MMSKRQVPVNQIFDVERNRLIGGAGDVVSYRMFLIEAAQYIGDGETIGILQDLVSVHPCPRTQASALQSLEKLDPAEAERARAQASREVVALSRLPLITGNYARSYSGA
jgi:hypothetical protein